LKVVFSSVEEATDVPQSNLDKWYREKEKLIGRFKEKKARRKKAFGGGRAPLFPKAEEAAAADAKERRLHHKIVTKTSFLKKLIHEAKMEKPVEAATAKFDHDYLRHVLQRRGLALRFPSCTKAMSLENGIAVCQGYFQWLYSYLRDELPDGKRARAPLDPVYGRYPLECRINKDEVLLPLIDISNFFSFRCRCRSAQAGERSRLVASAPLTCRRLTVGTIASPRSSLLSR
jgi:hypothetical protein